MFYGLSMHLIIIFSEAQVRLYLPPGVTEEEVLMYPLVVFADGAPGSQLVTAEFQLHWGSYLSSRRNHIYAWIDGRGSGSQGDKMMHEVYYRLGSVEVEDQIEVTRYLKENLAFIHPSHIAIWGWFYGGYVAALALAHDKTVFKCAISVAPVTSWLYYDSAFAERYMGTPLPQDNYLGFEKASLVKKAPKFKGKKLLLMHGTADDKVHVQQSLIFMKALIEEGVLFQTQVALSRRGLFPFKSSPPSLSNNGRFSERMLLHSKKGRIREHPSQKGHQSKVAPSGRMDESPLFKTDSTTKD
ncbi:Venom dipeptidyl peptidase 4 [Araneus ventricosus]|uniref:Venom dipeptidyl peptidase 4 n=1 Tax=Araneus ventricosus TaxID=182803 RepID=A0A4Y2C4E7_ARAVE|nr:Venom dipeptidyl peptidase 4 [Araneus ventricosus]